MARPLAMKVKGRVYMRQVEKEKEAEDVKERRRGQKGQKGWKGWR